jgi:hypothetical protein
LRGIPQECNHGHFEPDTCFKKSIDAWGRGSRYPELGGACRAIHEVRERRPVALKDLLHTSAQIVEKILSQKSAAKLGRTGEQFSQVCRSPNLQIFCGVER